MSYTNEDRTDIIALAVAVWGAAPGSDNLEGLASHFQNGGTMLELTEELTQSELFTNEYPTYLTNEEFAAEFVNNLVGGQVTAADAEWATDQLAGQLNAGASKAEVILGAIEALRAVDSGPWADAAAAFENQIEVAEYYSVDLQKSGDMAALKGAIAGVDETQASVDAAKESMEGGDTVRLTQQADNAMGTDGDDTFVAPVTQNETGSGALANTLETGDRIDGGAGTDTLRADLISSGSISGQSPAISPETTSVENVFLRAQQTNVSSNWMDELGFDEEQSEFFLEPNLISLLLNSIVGNGSLDIASNTTFGATVDAERMEGVEQWWSDNSRSDIRVEDVRTRSDETFIGMRNTDPAVSYEVYFNPLFMEGDMSQTASALTLTIQDITNDQAPASTELEFITVREINFSLAGESYTLDSDAMQDADTWAALETAIADELNENGLTNVTVEHRGNGVFVLEDADSGEFEVSAEEALIFGAASDLDVRNRVDMGQPVQIEGQTSANIVLDGVGNGSEGGLLNVAAMSGDRGVEVFNVLVGNDSHLAMMQSENSPNTFGRSFDNERQLEEVYVSHLDGANGDLAIGVRTQDPNGVSTTTDDRLMTNGIYDVRVFDASGFEAGLMLGAELSDRVFDKYLDGAEDTVQFSYLLADGGSNLSLDVDNAIASDPDFALEIIGGEMDDRINLTGLSTKDSTEIDGGNGHNTVETNTSTYAVPGNSSARWAGFTNIQTLVVAGTNDTTQDVLNGNMSGLENIIIATDNGFDDTTVVNLESTTNLTISGKNQTLGSGNSNNDQDFGTITLTNANADDQLVTLANTGRVDGVLTVGEIIVNGSASNVDNLEIASTGRRQTSNVVQNIEAEDASSIEFTGSQVLAAHVSLLADNPNQELDIDGSALENDLTLAVNADMLQEGSDDTITGTGGTSDLLALYGATGDINTNIDGFETIQFGWSDASGQSDLADLFDTGADQYAIAGSGNSIAFNAGNVSGESTYIIAGRGVNNALTLDNLSSGVNVVLGDDSGANVFFANPNTLNGTGELNLSMSDVVLNGATTEVNGFTTVNFDVAAIPTSPTTAAPRNHELDLNDDARTLNISGGSSQLDGDLLTLNGSLNTSLTQIDITGYAGEVDLGTWESLQGSNATVVVNEYDFTFDVGGDNTVVAVPAAGGADINEINTVDYTGAANELDDGESITINFAGGEYVFTNETGAALSGASINAAIIADASSAPGQFTIADDGTGLIELTADVLGDVPNALVSTTDGNLGAPAIVEDTKGDSLAGPSTITDTASDFITAFDFNTDAEEAGVVWQIDNFQAFESGQNIGLNNQTIIDLRDLGVDSAADINIQDGATFWAGLTTAEQNEFDGGEQAVLSNANNTVVTSNEGLNFTIALTGVADSDLVNENFAGIA